MNTNYPSVADIAATNGMNDWWPFILLFALFNRNGFGNGNCGCDGACATVGDVERGFNNQSTQQRFNGLDQGLCQLGYDNLAQISNLQNTVTQGNFGLQQAINNASVASMQDVNTLSRQMSDCCCGITGDIKDVNYNMQFGFNNMMNAMCNNTRDIIDNQNANYRALHDEITAFRMEDKDTQIRNLESQVNALNLAASQQNQNRYLIDQLRPCPQPAYVTCNPWGGQTYGACASQASCCC